MLLVLHEQHAAAGLLQRFAELLGFDRGMDAATDTTDVENAEIDIDIVGPCFGQHARDVACAKTDGCQTPGDIGDVRSQLRPGDGLPDAAIFLAQNDVIAMRGNPLGDEGGYRQCHIRFLFHRRCPRMPVSFWPR